MNYNYQPQPPSYATFMRGKMEQAQAQADREYYEMVNGQQYQQAPQQYQQAPQQPQQAATTNAYSITVTSEEQAESYPVNQNLNDMYFLHGDAIYVKTFDFGKGKWNDMRKFAFAGESVVPPEPDKFEELKAFVSNELAALKKEIMPKPAPKKKAEPVIEDDEDEFEEVVVRQRKTPAIAPGRKTTKGGAV